MKIISQSEQGISPERLAEALAKATDEERMKFWAEYSKLCPAGARRAQNMLTAVPSCDRLSSTSTG